MSEEGLERPFWKSEPPSRRRAKLSELFGVDLRALAAFRISIGTLLLLNLWNRSQDLVAHYTDAGIMPRPARITLFEVGNVTGLEHWWSLHFLSGTAWSQALLFLISAVFAVWFLIGYRTRLAAFASWLLVVSLHMRNPMIMDGGDLMLECMMFWAMFLPLGAVASVDAALDPDRPPLPKRVLSAASVAILLQMFMVYFFTALLKNHPVWTREFTAVYYALSVEAFTTRIGYFVLRFPLLMKVLTAGALGLELLGPFLAFLPYWTGRMRFLVAVAFMGFHLGLFLTMDLALFPWIAIACWMVYLPTGFWDRLSRFLLGTERPAVLLYAEPGAARSALRLLRCAAFQTTAPVRAASEDEAVSKAMHKARSAIAVVHDDTIYTGHAAARQLLLLSPLWSRMGRLPMFAAAVRGAYRAAGAVGRRIGFPFRRPETVRFRLRPVSAALVVALLVYTFLWNVRELDFSYWESKTFSKRWNFPARVTGLDQVWDMFAPYPLTDDGWYVMRGILRDGDVVNLWDPGAPLPYTKPERLHKTYRNQRWRKYLMNLWDRANASHRKYLGDYLKHRWDAEFAGDDEGREVKRVEVYYMLEPTPAPGEPNPVPEKVTIWDWNYD